MLLLSVEHITVCIVVYGEKFQSLTMTLTFIGQCPMSRSELYYNVLKFQVNSHTHTHIGEYSIVL